MKVLVTGSGGLIGSEAVKYHTDKGGEVLGLDNDMRGKMFGPNGSIKSTLDALSDIPEFRNYKKDIRNRKSIEAFFKKHGPFQVLWHCAAQPAHDFAAANTYLDHDINCEGTFNILESFRKYSGDGTLIHLSTSKVYGANPNVVNLVELPSRYDYAPEQTMPGITENGIKENFPIDNTTHSLFGASKLAGDIAAQEYGRYFGLKIGIFRGDCLTGKNSMGVPLHGFLSFLVQSAINKTPYTVIGYKGLQCRGQSEEYNWQVLAFEAQPDHIHLFLSVPPGVPVSKVANQLKGYSSIVLRRAFPELKKKLGASLWTEGYYVSTAGYISEDKVKRYIEEQQNQLRRQRVKEDIAQNTQRTLWQSRGVSG